MSKMDNAYPVSASYQSDLCFTCKQPFTSAEQENSFRARVSPSFNGATLLISPPRHCSSCREKMRLRFRNGYNLYARDCDLCQKDVISVYPKDTVSPVYCPECWWGDKWDALDYGMVAYDQSLFISIGTLLAKVPVLSLVNTSSENSTYAHDSQNNKNCYLVFSTIESVDSMYNFNSNRMRNCLDCYWSGNCELSYELINCSESYQSAYSSHGYRLNFSYFCENCVNCTNCFGCFNLVDKQYYIFNKPYSKEEYETKISIYLSRIKTWNGCEDIKKEVSRFFATQPHKYANVVNCENSIGDFLVNTKNCFNCYNVINSEDCRYIDEGVSLKDCNDCNLIGRSELMYNCQSCVGQINICCSFSTDCSNVTYCDHCYNCHNCFGCIGLRQKEYCIFNKQYSKAEYEHLVPLLIKKLVDAGQWGEFFPEQLAPIHFEDSAVPEHFPESAAESINTTLAHTIVIDNTSKEPKSNCSVCHKAFLMLKQELAFYEAHQLPLPAICFSCRQRRRVEQKNPKGNIPAICAKCQKSIISNYPFQDKTIVYCEDCYRDARI